MSQVKLSKNYKPTAEEDYMGPKQLQYFRVKLLEWRQSLLEESQQTIDQMRDAARDVSDEAERASHEAEITFELRTRDRYRKLLSKIKITKRHRGAGRCHVWLWRSTPCAGLPYFVLVFWWRLCKIARCRCPSLYG